MSILRFESLRLISLTERKAASFQFHPRMTLITGENHTGKSLILKSLYWTLGAEPAAPHPAWKELNLIAILTLTLGEAETLTVIRKGKSFYIFDKERRCLLRTSRVTTELGPFIASKVDVSLRLATRQQEMAVPPPAYIFLPFYIDQEKGWADSWSSFGNLTHFVNWQGDLVKFHTGQRTNKYYDITAEIGAIKRRLDYLEGALKYSREAYDNLVSQIGHLPIAFDRLAYQRSLHTLLKDLDAIQTQREKLTGCLTDSENERILLQNQARVARAALAEAEKDYSYASDLEGEDVFCPTCGTKHENSFIKRYSLAETVEDYRVFLAEIDEKLSELDAINQKISREATVLSSKVDAINATLHERRGKLKVSDIIESEGHKKAREVLRNQLEGYTKQIEQLEGRKAVLNKEIKKVVDKRRNKEITEFFFDCYTRFLNELAVYKIATDDRGEIPTKVRDTGSEQPRAVLSYSLAIIETLAKFSSTPKSPFVADSPLQQEQDPANSRLILQTLADQKYLGGQMVIGTLSSLGVKFPGSEIHLSRKYQLLDEAAYAESVQDLLSFNIDDFSSISSAPDTP